MTESNSNESKTSSPSKPDWSYWNQKARSISLGCWTNRGGPRWIFKKKWATGQVQMQGYSSELEVIIEAFSQLLAWIKMNHPGELKNFNNKKLEPHKNETPEDYNPY